MNDENEIRGNDMNDMTPSTTTTITIDDELAVEARQHIRELAELRHDNAMLEGKLELMTSILKGWLRLRHNGRGET